MRKGKAVLRQTYKGPKSEKSNPPMGVGKAEGPWSLPKCEKRKN